MSKVEVLVTTMHQSDLQKFTQMNLQTDAVIANQTDRNGYAEAEIGGHTVKLVSTNTRGTSRNRNIALAHASQDAEYILFSDDDLVFNDGYEQAVLSEFQRHPEAEAIKFNLHDLSATRKISMRRIERFEKATRRNMSSSGVCGLVLRAGALRRCGLHFHEDFGPGTENYCGEDTIFLMELLDKRVPFYRSPVDIAGIDQTVSSRPTGHDERFFTTAGMVIGTIYPRLSRVIVIRSALKAYRRKTSPLGFWKILSCYYRGIRRHV